MSKLKLLRNALQTVIDNIDTGNSRLSDEQCDEFMGMISFATNAEQKYSKYQACKYLGISRATLDNYVRDGKIEIRTQQGFKEKFFYKRDLDKIKKN